MTAAAIEVEALSMRYPKVPGYRDLLLSPFRREYLQALEGASFSVPSGILFGFLGPNGAGKTTLIKILTTLILPTSGNAFVAGLDVQRDPETVKKRIGVVMSDERSFYWRLTGRQNLMFFANLHGITGAAATKRIDLLLERVGLAGKAEARFSDFSSGQKQKLAIARGMLAEPEILFFDEPTRSLDPISAAQVRTFIRENLVEQTGKTVFLTTHNLYEAEEISDRVGIINRGRILATGTVAEISARLRSREHYLLRLVRVPENLAGELARVPGVASVVLSPGSRAGAGECLELTLAEAASAVPRIVALAVSRGGEVLECARRESSLTEIFSEIITEDTQRGDAR